MHARRRGKSSSKPASRREKPDWINMSMEEIENIIVNLYKGGLHPSQIGIRLRDQYGIPDVKLVTGKKIQQILEEAGYKQKIPEDLMFLMKKAVNLHAHLQVHKKDLSNRRGLQLVEAKIRRLIKYYKRKGKLPEDWKYSISTAKLMVE